MKYSLHFIEEARLDIKEAFQWYDSKLPELGNSFLDSLYKSLEVIERNPYQYQIQLISIRKAVLKRFPYLVIFTIKGQRVIVLGVIHSSRNPTVWKKRT